MEARPTPRFTVKESTSLSHGIITFFACDYETIVTGFIAFLGSKTKKGIYKNMKKKNYFKIGAIIAPLASLASLTSISAQANQEKQVVAPRVKTYSLNIEVPVYSAVGSLRESEKRLFGDNNAVALPFKTTSDGLGQYTLHFNRTITAQDRVFSLAQVSDQGGVRHVTWATVGSDTLSDFAMDNRYIFVGAYELSNNQPLYITSIESDEIVPCQTYTEGVDTDWRTIVTQAFNDQTDLFIKSKWTQIFLPWRILNLLAFHGGASELLLNITPLDNFTQRMDQIVTAMSSYYGLSDSFSGVAKKHLENIRVFLPETFSHADDSSVFPLLSPYSDTVSGDARRNSLELVGLEGATLLASKNILEDGVLIHEMGHYFSSQAYFNWNISESLAQIGQFEVLNQFAANPTYTHIAGSDLSSLTNFLNRVDSSKSYEELGSTGGINGAEYNQKQETMFWQLQGAFGRNFFPTMNQIIRTDYVLQKGLLDDYDWSDDGLQILMQACAKAAQTDLTDFFHKWGLYPSAETASVMAMYPKLARDITNVFSFAPTVPASVKELKEYNPMPINVDRTTKQVFAYDVISQSNASDYFSGSDFDANKAEYMYDKIYFDKSISATLLPVRMKTSGDLTHTPNAYYNEIPIHTKNAGVINNVDGSTYLKFHVIQDIVVFENGSGSIGQLPADVTDRIAYTIWLEDAQGNRRNTLDLIPGVSSLEVLKNTSLKNGWMFNPGEKLVIQSNVTNGVSTFSSDLNKVNRNTVLTDFDLQINSLT